ncbi:MAG TPA: class I SAM-dependent methyltransferase [Anaerolineae bacterium]|nr:class I SAM-dependent methyltransferase [Anaerolineae bacterium]
MYPLTLDLVDFLTGAEAAAAALDALRVADLRDAVTLERITELRKSFSPEQAAVLLDQARLRQKAVVKFPHAARMFFDDEALQQASSRAVAVYRVGRFAHYRRVADLGCGIGADTLALAEAGVEVLAVELDPVRARLAILNAAACGLAERVRAVCADWTTLALDVDAAFVDPARRVEGRRVFGLDAMTPPLAAILALRECVPDVAVKVAPGVDHAEIPAEAEVEFISERGEMKEAVLWFGDLRTGAARRATLLPGLHQLDSLMPADEIPLTEPRAYLYEPDPAVLRATLVKTLATQLGAAQMDADIAYLTSDRLVETPFARAWRVVRHGPFNLKTLNRWLRQLGAGDVVVKKRGSPVDPGEFRRRLKLTPGGSQMTVFLTHVQGKPWMVLGEEIGVRS